MAISRSSRPPFRLAIAIFAAAMAVWTIPLLGAAVPRPALAEEASESALRPGAWAAEFELDPSYRYALGISSGATISAKRHHSARSALRFGVGVGFDESRADEDDSYERFSIYSFPNAHSAAGNGESHDEYQSYAVFLHFLRYHPVRAAVVIFWELGPSFHYAESSSHEETLYPSLYTPDPSEWYTADRQSVRRLVALDLNLGFEWFFNRRLSLGARTGAWGGYGWGTDTIRRESVTSDNSYYYLEHQRSEKEAASLHVSPATVLFSAYF